MTTIATLRAEAKTLARQMAVLVFIILAFEMAAKAEPKSPGLDCLTKTNLAFSSLAERWQESERNLEESLDHSLLYHEVRLSLCHAELMFKKTGIERSAFDVELILRSQPKAYNLMQHYKSAEGRKLAFNDSLSCVSTEEHAKCVESIS